MRQYRLIYDSPTAGKYNMAIDDAMMTSVVQNKSLPTLRLYGWSPPCLSIGYAQKWQDVDCERLQSYGWNMVRRPTGGRAILHMNELTYSLVLPLDHPLAKGRILDSYRRISKGLLAGLERLGLQPLAQEQPDTLKMTGPVCFETPSHYEITLGDGRKLIGSAQTRRRGVIMQHGSLPLCGDVTQICDVLAYPDEGLRQTAKTSIALRAATLADALNGQIVDWQTAADAIVLGFMMVFDAEFVEGELTSDEQAQVEQLVTDVYANEDKLKRL